MSDPLNTMIGGNAKEALKSYIERIERLEQEKAELAEDVKEIYAEAKGNGFDTKIMRQVIRRRKIEREEVEETDTMIEVYEDAIASLDDMME